VTHPIDINSIVPILSADEHCAKNTEKGNKMIRDLTRMEDRWNPFWIRRFFDQDMDEMFRNVIQPSMRYTEVFTPKCDFRETEDHYFISMDLPGIPREDIHIDVKNNELHVYGETHRQKKEEGTTHIVERFKGNFYRTFALTDEVEPSKVEANFKDGVLYVALPKAEASKPRKIQINEGLTDKFKKLMGTVKEETKKIKAA
jgi:HSP20 family protein